MPEERRQDFICAYHQANTEKINFGAGYLKGLSVILGLTMTGLLMFGAWVANSVVETNKVVTTHTSTAEVQVKAMTKNVEALQVSCKQAHDLIVSNRILIEKHVTEK